MNDLDRPAGRPADSLRDSAVAALGGVAFLGGLVFVASAWGFADAGHPLWAAVFAAAAFACAGVFGLASRTGSGKPPAAPSDRVALERIMPLPAGIDPAARAALRYETRRLALLTAGCVTMIAFGMLAWQYAVTGRTGWSAVAAVCAVAGAALLAMSWAARRRVA